MSRISKYKESIIKFLITCTNNDLDDEFFKVFMSNYNFYIPIISLTIQYNIDTNRRNIYGYYIATIITLIEYINYLREKKYSEDEENKVLAIIKKLVDTKIKTINKNVFDFINKHFYVYLDKIIKKYEFNAFDNKLVYSAKYNFDDIKLQKKYDGMMIINYEHLMEYIHEVYGNLCNIGITMNFLIHMNNLDEYNEYIKIIQLFGLIIKIGNDFKRFTEDIKNGDKICVNTLVNIGIQKTFNLYVENKSYLIEELIKNKLYTHTIKEILDQIENNVDNIINNSNVTIESTYEKS